MTAEERAEEFVAAWEKAQNRKIDADSRFKADYKEDNKARERIKQMADSMYVKAKTLFNKDEDWRYLDDEDVLDVINNNKDISAQDYAKQKAELKRKDEFKYLISPEEGGKNWYDMSARELWAEAEKLGYDMDIPEDRQAFMDKLTGYQQDFDKSNIVKETLNSPAGVVAQIAYPTATDEAVKQVMTGNYNDDSIYGSAGLDFGTSVLQLTTPGGSALRGFGTPIVQAASEAARQAVKANTGIGNGKFDVSPVLAAGIGGATTPASKGVAQSLFSKGNGKGKQIAEGIESTTKGAPIDLEQERLTAMFNKGKELGADWEKKFNKPTVTPETIGEFNANQEARKVYKTFDNANLLPDDIYKPEFRKANVGEFKYSEAKPVVYEDPASSKMLTEKVQNVEGPAYQSEYQAVKNIAPEAFNKMEGKVNPLKEIGVKIGKGLEYLGGKVEPTFKFNPITALTDLSNANIPEIGKQVNSTDYKKTSWYKNMPKKQREMIDEAYKEKELLAD